MVKFVQTCKSALNLAKQLQKQEILVTACRSDTVTKKTVFKGFQRFQEGNESLESKERSGHHQHRETKMSPMSAHLSEKTDV
jgi:hypothetical protein